MSDRQRMIERLDRILSSFMQQEPLPGMAVSVVYDQQMLYARGFGVTDIRSEEPVTEHTRFHMASISKTLVATAIMQLAEDGLIQLEGLVTDYVPYFEMAGDDTYRSLTIRQLLSHTSGLPDENDFCWEQPEYDEGSLERYVRSLKDYHMQGEPGQSFAYSNIGYEILGDVIAKVTGHSFELYMKKNMLEPAAMRNSTFLKEEVARDSMAMPHVLGMQGGYGAEYSPIFPYHRAHGPSSTLYSNAVDMCRYALSHLHKCRGASANDDAAGFIDMTSYEQMWSKHAVTGYGDMLNDMGLGWFIGEYKGRRVMSHMGRDTGFRSNFWLLPDEGIAIIVMMNADYIGNKVLCEAILDVLFGDEVPYIRRSLAHHLSQVTLAAGVDAAIQEYAEIQQSCPERFLVLEGEFNAGAYTLMGRGSLQEGIRVLQLSVQLFPESSNLHDSLGEMYRLAGERELALKHYQRSVELDSEHLDGKRMIEELLQEGQS